MLGIFKGLYRRTEYCPGIPYAEMDMYTVPDTDGICADAADIAGWLSAGG